MLKLGRHVLIAAFLLHTSALGDATNGTTPPPPPPPPLQSSLTDATIHSTTFAPTCPSRTINYITHRLPQQCLKSSWSATTPTTSSQEHEATISTDTIPIPFIVTPKTAGAGEAESDTLDRPETASETATAEPTQSSEVGDAHTNNKEPVRGHPSEATQAITASSEPEREVEADSALDNANFLSFEEWKRQNLAKAGQSPENVGQGRGSASGPGRKPRPVNINNELDFLGEDTEIDLDFGFGNNAKADQAASVHTKTSGSGADNGGGTKEALASYRPRSKDAGKTCKERFNYASFDCAATVLKTNPQCKSWSSVLVENKDSYMINECGAQNKFIIVELCDDILVDTIVLANFEFFSSQFRTFRVSVSDRYPVKLERWKELGIFEARNSRDIQSFLVENPLIWARYLRIEFLSHYGNEYYCPVSLLRVHGTTMMEEFRHQEEIARGEDDMDEVLEVDSPVVEAIKPVSTQENSDETVESRAETSREINKPTDSGSQASAEDARSKEPTSAVQGAEAVTEPVHIRSSDTTSIESDTNVAVQPPVSTPGSTTAGASVKSSSSAQVADDHSTQDNADAVSVGNTTSSKNSSTSEASHSSSSSTAGASAGNTTSATTAASSPASEARVAQSGEARQNATSNGSARSTQASTDGGKQASSSTQPQPAAPTTQESFFKSIHKRLQMLESNSTLSLQYIEDQSRILRDAFTKVEKRQLGKTEQFLEHLNNTVMAELRGFRQQYDQLWQSTVIELETQREQHQREVLAISARLTLLADELVFQKRMLVVQSTLILLCLGLVLFVRSGSSYLELPLVQQMMHKSQSALRLQFDSPSSSPPRRRHRRNLSSTDERRRFWSFGGAGSDGSSGARSPGLEFSGPTATTDDGDGDGDEGSSGSGASDGSARLSPLRQTQSGPATPSGREGQGEWSGSEAKAGG